VNATYNPAARLREHVNRLIGRECGHSDLIEVMRLVPLLIEHEKSKASYSHVILYCDWVQHGSIERHSLAWDILERMNAALARYDQGEGILAVSHAMSLTLLRQEMIVLFLHNTIGTDLLDSYRNWTLFVSVLLADLCDRPIGLPRKPSNPQKKTIHSLIARMAAKWSDPPRWPRAFVVTREVRPESHGPFLWRLEYDGRPHFIQSEIQMTERPSDFRLP
jgi:hypothetical protein